MVAAGQEVGDDPGRRHRTGDHRRVYVAEQGEMKAMKAFAGKVLST